MLHRKKPENFVSSAYIYRCPLVEKVESCRQSNVKLFQLVEPLVYYPNLL